MPNDENEEFDSTNSESEFDVEQIVAHRYNPKCKRLEFLIKWKGYDSSENTWEPLPNLKCPGVLNDYLQRIGEPLKLNTNEKVFLAKIGIKLEKSSKKTRQSTKTIVAKYVSKTFSELESNSYSKITLASMLKLSKNPKIDTHTHPDCASMLNHESDFKESPKSYIHSNPYDIRFARHKSFSEFQTMLSSIPGSKLTLINDIDYSAPEPSNFVYLTDYVYGSGVIQPDPEFLVPCSCGKNGGDCSTSRCSCRMLNPPNNASAYTQGMKLAFTKNSNQPLVSAIYECNLKCACSRSKSCKNRIVQLGRQIELNIVKLDTRGWGVRTPYPISKGTFIDQYLGEVITTSEARSRLQSAQARLRGAKAGSLPIILEDEDVEEEQINEPPPSVSYMFDLDFNSKQDECAECDYTIDAYRMGNVSHFFNHSCDPNMRVVPVFIDCLDARLHRNAFFACRDIKSGEELTFDYTGKSYYPDESEDSSGPSSDIIVEISDLGDKPSLSFKQHTKCLCGSEKCRKYIFI